MAVPTEKNRLQGIAQILVDEDLVLKENALQYQELAIKDKLTFLNYLVSHGIVPAQEIALTIAKSFGVPLLDLDAVDVESIPAHLLNEKLIRRHGIVPLFNRGNQLYVAVDDPSKQTSMKEFQFHTGLHSVAIVVETDKLSVFIDKLLNKKDSQGLAEYLDDSSNLEGLEYSIEEDEDENSYKSEKGKSTI